jgi:hypothetical protein
MSLVTSAATGLFLLTRQNRLERRRLFLALRSLYKHEPPPGNRPRKRFIRLETGKASRRRINSNSARSLSARNAASAASRFG